MALRILISSRLPRFHAKSSRAVFTPSFADKRYGFICAFTTHFIDGLVLSFLLDTTNITANISPEYSAIVVAMAAPFIPMAGSPNLPNIITQSRNILTPDLIIPYMTSGFV